MKVYPKASGGTQALKVDPLDKKGYEETQYARLLLGVQQRVSIVN